MRTQNLHRSTASTNNNNNTNTVEPEPPNLTNPKRVKKLTKFFGEDPPLMRLFLRTLGYEVSIIKSLPIDVIQPCCNFVCVLFSHVIWFHYYYYFVFFRFSFCHMTLEICKYFWIRTCRNDRIAVLGRRAFTKDGHSIGTTIAYFARGANFIMQRYNAMYCLEM